MTPAWDESLTEHDVKVLEARPPKPRGIPFGRRSALLVIDMNRGALGEDRPAYEQQAQYPGACGESGWTALRRMQPLIAAARSAGVPVVYSRNVARASQGLPRADDPTWMYSELSPLSELTPEIPMAPGGLTGREATGERLLSKRTLSTSSSTEGSTRCCSSGTAPAGASGRRRSTLWGTSSRRSSSKSASSTASSCPTGRRSSTYSSSTATSSPQPRPLSISTT